MDLGAAREFLFKEKSAECIEGIHSYGLRTEYCFPQGHVFCIIEATDWLDALCLMQPLRLCRIRVRVKDEGRKGSSLKRNAVFS